MNRSFALLALVAMLALMVMAPGPRADNAKATGGVGFETQSGNDARAQFTAHDSEPAKGQVEVEGHGPDGDVNFHGEVDCYHQVDENTARFSGEITEIENATSTHFRITVHDGGTPGSAGDGITVQRQSGTYDCEDGPDANRPVDNGNLKVHNHDS